MDDATRTAAEVLGKGTYTADDLLDWLWLNEWKTEPEGLREALEVAVLIVAGERASRAAELQATVDPKVIPGLRELLTTPTILDRDEAIRRALATETFTDRVQP